MFWDLFSFAMIIVLAFLCGWLLAYCMGRLNFPRNPTERFFTGLIWIGIGFVLFFVKTKNVDLSTMVAVCIGIGFVLRSAMEFLLRLREIIDEMDDVYVSEAVATTVPHRAIETRLLNPNPVQDDYRPGDNVSFTV